VARPRWAAYAVLATITLAACTAGGKAETVQGGVEATTTTTTATSPSAPAALSTPAAPAAPAAPPIQVAKTFADLSRAIITAVPAGYDLQPDEVDDTGPSTLEKAIADDGEDDARAVFTRDRFMRGYQRMWSKNDSDQIVVYLYQFAAHTGALDYAKRITAASGGQTNGASTGTFGVAGIAGAIGVNGSDANFPTSSVTFVKGPYSVQVTVNGGPSGHTQALVSSLALDQYSRL
jgi:hypothetical protein